jgi:hypothetical protein
MPGSQLFNKSGFYSHIGANRFIPSATINLGSTRGSGSSTRIFKNVKREFGASAAINQFINVKNPSAGGTIPGPEPGPEPGPPNPDIVLLESIATQDSNGNWVLNGDTTILDYQVLVIENGSTLIIPTGLKLTNNGTIENRGTIINNGTIQNTGTIQNRGTIQNTGGTIDNCYDGNRGTITGNEINDGIVIECSIKSFIDNNTNG